MTPAVLDLRTTCLHTIAADEFARRGDFDPPHPEFLRMATVLFALTASTDPVVQAAIGEAVRVADGGAR